jgi:transcriptional regulator with XRE-family HTH domain
MANDRLREAMLTARLDVEELADAVYVDPRTVERWLAGRRPHRRRRWAVATSLGVDERAIWPDSQSPATTNWQTDELVDIYGYRADLPAHRWWAMLSETTGQIDLLGYALLFLFEDHPRLPQLLTGKAASDCPVRIMLIDRECSQARERDREEDMGGALIARAGLSMRHLEPLVDLPGIEVRLHSTPLYNSIFRFGQEMLSLPTSTQPPATPRRSCTYGASMSTGRSTGSPRTSRRCGQVQSAWATLRSRCSDLRTGIIDDEARWLTEPADAHRRADAGRWRPRDPSGEVQ